jgi:hypothetical protein
MISATNLSYLLAELDARRQELLLREFSLCLAGCACLRADASKLSGERN